uniref:Uncharacterized protein n=1 Tax=Setaria viridis TaxID=4556 RepID=A0A4U6UDF4_SETVI|nr:hypothetical protein SEVIR_5G131700v2 [Setaria viridis]
MAACSPTRRPHPPPAPPLQHPPRPPGGGALPHPSDLVPTLASSSRTPTAPLPHFGVLTHRGRPTPPDPVALSLIPARSERGRIGRRPCCNRYLTMLQYGFLDVASATIFSSPSLSFFNLPSQRIPHPSRWRHAPQPRRLVPHPSGLVPSPTAARSPTTVSSSSTSAAARSSTPGTSSPTLAAPLPHSGILNQPGAPNTPDPVALSPTPARSERGRIGRRPWWTTFGGRYLMVLQ